MQDYCVCYCLQVEYTTKVYITQIDVYEVNKPNMTSSIIAYTYDLGWITLWEGSPQTPTTDAQIFTPPLILQVSPKTYAIILKTCLCQYIAEVSTSVDIQT